MHAITVVTAAHLAGHRVARITPTIMDRDS